MRAGGARMLRIRANGGTAETVWASDSVLGASLTGLPEGRGVLFARCGGASCARELSVHALDARDGTSRLVAKDALRGWYAGSGHVVFVRPNGVLAAAPFDLKTLAVGGEAVPVLDSVSILNLVPSFALSEGGALVMRVGATVMTQARHDLVWVDRTGKAAPLDTNWTFRLTAAGLNAGWALSPDGKRLAIGLNTESGDDIWLKQLPSGPLARLTFDTAAEVRPRWTRDGRSVTFTSLVGNGLGTTGQRTALVMRAADGTGGDSLVVPYRPNGVFEHAFSPDGQWLAVRMGGQVNVIGSRDISIIALKADTTPRPLLASKLYDESAIALSPDGKWIAFESEETGHPEVYIRPFPAVDGGKWQLSNGGGRAPLWARNGKELFYVNPGRELIAVPVAPVGGSPGLGERKALFRLRPEWYLRERENYTPFDIAPDGSRFLMARQLQSEELRSAPVVYVENWLTELRQKVAKR